MSLTSSLGEVSLFFGAISFTTFLSWMAANCRDIAESSAGPFSCTLCKTIIIIIRPGVDCQVKDLNQRRPSFSPFHLYHHSSQLKTNIKGIRDAVLWEKRGKVGIFLKCFFPNSLFYQIFSHFSPFFLNDCAPNQGEEPWLLRVLTRWVDKMEKLLPATVRLPEKIYSHHISISCPTDPMKKCSFFEIPFFKQHKGCLLPWEHESQPLVTNHSLLLIPLSSCLNLTKRCCHLWAIGQPKSTVAKSFFASGNRFFEAEFS